MRSKPLLLACPITLLVACSSAPDPSSRVDSALGAGDGGVDARTDAGAASTCAAITSSASGSGSMSGFFDGPLPPVLDVTAALGPANGVATEPWVLAIGFHEYVNACGLQEAGAAVAGADEIRLVLQSTHTGTSSPFTPGTYSSQGLFGYQDAGTYGYSLTIAR
jgi:hypothetical protein